MTDFRTATSLMAEGRAEEADTVIRAFLQNNPAKKSNYEEAIDIYLAGHRYQQARDVHRLYRLKTGKKLDLEPSEEEIEEQAKLHEEVVSLSREFSALAEPKVFERTGWLYWGSFWTVKELRLYRDKVVISVFVRTYEYKWPDIISATLVIFESDSPGHLRRIIELRTPDKTFKLDISNANHSQFPGYWGVLLLAELRKKLKIGVIKKSESRWLAYIARFKAAIMLIGAASLLIRYLIK